MPGRVPWTQRTFGNFDFPAELHPELVERLRGTPARVEERVRTLPPDMLRRRQGETWSIQENIGHLADLESLFTARLADYDTGLAVLRPADMSNRATWEADHNRWTIDEVLARFRSLCGDLVGRLEAISPTAFARTARHPRLERPMRVVDMLFFHAEHDDYHLARITDLIRCSTPGFSD